MTRFSGVRAEFLSGLRATLPAWLLAHAVLFYIGHRLEPHAPLDPLFAWDTHWYLAEASGMAHGGNVFTDSTGVGGLAHFFPLTSLCVAAIAVVTRIPVTFVLFGFCWLLALVFGALVHMVVMREARFPELDRDRLASRAAWLSQLAPGAFALVMGYTEPLAGVLAVLYFLAVRKQRTGWAFVFGLLAGISRPTGVVLALPGFIEAIRAAHRAGWTPRAVAAGLAQSAAPVLGLFTYLGYCQLHFHDWILPYAQQMAGGNRGAVTQNPLNTIHVLSSGYPYGNPIIITSIACAALALLGLIGCWRRLPVSFTAWSAVMLVLGVTSPWFTSEPRYLAAIFPLLIGLPALLRWRLAWFAVLAVNLVLFYWVGWLALGWHQVA